MADNNEENNPPNNNPENNPPYLNPKSLQDLIQENLNTIRGFQNTYQNIPTLGPMLATLNTIVGNIDTLTQ
ncbi:hypothetical protein, partial [[Clostridium] innocuum]|uniref:hypothetical protein n=1 Tax=Clostridium innocuum TaxID=1522 RepID=UPI001E516F3C